jgi:ATP-binding cassette, subfamily B, bacterial
MKTGRYSKPLRYIARQWRYLAFILVLTAFYSVIGAVQPWPMKILIDHAVRHDRLPAVLESVLHRMSLPVTPGALVMIASVAGLLLFALNCLLDIALSWAWAVAGQRMVFDLSTDLFHRLQRLSLRYHREKTVGDSLSRISGDTWCVYTLTSQLFSPIQQTMTLVTMGALAWKLNASLAAMTMAAAPLLAGCSVYFGKRLKQRAQLGREAATKLVTFVQQTLPAIPIVQAFLTQQRNVSAFRELSVEAVRVSQRGALLGSVYGMVSGLITTSATAAVVFIGATQVIAGKLSIGSLLVFLAYLRSMQSATEGLLKTYSSVKPVEASIDRVVEILEVSADEISNRPGAQPVPARQPGDRGHIQFEDVSFAYEPGRAILKHIDFEARPGDIIALVGATGAGKSTLVSLIPRFYDPEAGRILFDGVDLCDLQVDSLRSQISLVLQDPFIFPISVADNIGYSRIEATRDEIVAAAVAANADEFIRRLPDGYDTVVGERGTTLSGGERQRLAIARAILRNAPVLILDEPTSAVDAETEALILGALENLMRGRTTFIIAHRLSTVRRASRILVLEHGQIVESGTHQELLTKRGHYHNFHTLQYTPAAAAEVGAA